MYKSEDNPLNGGKFKLYTWYDGEKPVYHASAEGAFELCLLPYEIAIFTPLKVLDLSNLIFNDDYVDDEFRNLVSGLSFVLTLHLTTQISMALIPVGAVIGTIQGIHRRRKFKKSLKA